MVVKVVMPVPVVLVVLVVTAAMVATAVQLDKMKAITSHLMMFKLVYLQSLLNTL